MFRRYPATPMTTLIASLGTIPDISTIAVNPDSYNPCVPPGGTPTLHCDLATTDPGCQAGAMPPAVERLCRSAWVPHAEYDHFAIYTEALRFAHADGSHGSDQVCGEPVHRRLRASDCPRCRTARPARVFRFHECPLGYAANPPAPVTAQSLGYDPCTPANFALVEPAFFAPSHLLWSRLQTTSKGRIMSLSSCSSMWQ